MVFSDFRRFSYVKSLIILCFALQISGCISDENDFSSVDESDTSDRNAAAGNNGSNGIGNNTITVVDNTTEADSTAEVDSSTEVDSTAEVDSSTEVDSTAEVDSSTEVDSTAEVDSSTEVDSTAEVDSSTEVDSTADADSTTVVDSNDPATVTVNWTAPVARADDTPLLLSEITGYRVYYGQASGDYSNQLEINDSSAIGATLDVTPGLYYFVVTCLDTAGHESVYSEEVMISI